MVDKKNRAICAICVTILFYSCSGHIPKPYGYYRINLPEHHYERFEEYGDFVFDLSTNAVVEHVPNAATGRWFNIYYPDFDATIFCSYSPMNPSKLAEFSEDSRKFVYKHAVKADAITGTLFSKPEDKVYGIFYNLEGNVATPIQLTLTDSTSNFFRASLLFNSVPNQDSIAPILNYIKADIKQLMESFRWKR